jgi:AraC family cel operon transcriptional repressor
VEKIRLDQEPERLRHAAFITDMRPVNASRTLFRDNKRHNPHSHDFQEFFLVTTGRLVHEIDSCRSVLEEGSFCFVRPSSVHCFQKIRDCPRAELLNVAFRIPFLDGLPPYVRDILATYPDPVVLPQALRDLFEERVTQIQEIDGRDPDRSVAILQVLLSEVALGLKRKSPTDRPTPPSWLTAGVEAMKRPENYREGLSRFIAITARSQEHLNRMMRRHYQRTPTEFVNNLRLNEAIELLTRSDTRVIEIALRTGFNNISHFMRLFRKRFGSSPGTYRKSNRRIVEG